MNTPAARHSGLPFVPQPAPDELLGSLLLRVAQLYGLGLTTLLGRLGARPTGEAHVPHWFAICGASLSLDALSTASCLSRVDLAAMAPPSCRPVGPKISEPARRACLLPQTLIRRLLGIGAG
jgi:hypothetical protein